jgi:hypothetical protein
LEWRKQRFTLLLEDQPMFHRIVVRAFPLLSLLSYGCFAQCSLDTVRGTWGYYGRGTLMMKGANTPDPAPVPFLGLGIQRIDAQGQYTLEGTLNVGGQIQPAAGGGSIQVNPDCTATDTYALPGIPGTGGDRLVILDNGKEMRLMGTTGVLGPAVSMAYYRRISSGEPHCTSEMVHGVYMGTQDGIFLTAAPGQSQPVSLPYSGIWAIAYQWDGSGTGAATTTVPGTILDWSFPEMPITVKSDCTASMTWKAIPKGSSRVSTGSESVLVLNDGDELWVLQTQNSASGSFAIGIYKRISMLPVLPKW